MVSTALQGMEIDKEAIQYVKAGRIEGTSISLAYDANGFIVTEGTKHKRVRPYDVDKALSGKSPEQIAKFSKLGTFLVTKMHNGDYKVRAHGRIRGGGPITAAALYWITKSACWFGIGLGTTAVATGIVAATAVTGGVPLATIGSGAAVVATAGVPVTAAVAGGAVIGGTAAAVGTATVAAAATTAATAVTVASAGIGATATAGVIAGTVAGIEAASIAAFAAGMYGITITVGIL
jgi:hypothetical protein